jgi:hypothetical protein
MNPEPPEETHIQTRAKYLTRSHRFAQSRMVAIPVRDEKRNRNSHNEISFFYVHEILLRRCSVIFNKESKWRDPEEVIGYEGPTIEAGGRLDHLQLGVDGCD